MASKNARRPRRASSNSNALGPIGALLAVLLVCLVVGTWPQQPRGGGGGAFAHTEAFSTGVGNAYIGAASVHEAIVQGNFFGARRLLDGVLRDLQATRGHVRTDEQRQILRLEDRGLLLVALIDLRSPAGVKASRDFMNLVELNQIQTLTPPAKIHGKPMSASRAANAHAPVFSGTAGSAPKPARRAAVKPAARPSSRQVHAAVPLRPTTTRVAAAWPMRPTTWRKGGHAKPSDAGIARVRLAKAVVGAIHAEQALLAGRMGQALGHVRSLRTSLKQARAKGTPWQRRALTRLDKQANQLQYELAAGNPAAFAHASGLVDASLQVQQSFKQAGGPGGHTVKVAWHAGGKPHAKAHAGKPGKKAKAGGKKATKKSGKPGKPGKPHPKVHPKPHPKPAPHPRPVDTMPDLPQPPMDPTMDEEHPGALPLKP